MGIWLNLGTLGILIKVYTVPGKILENFHANINITRRHVLLTTHSRQYSSARTSDYRRQKKTIPSPSSTGSERPISAPKCAPREREQNVEKLFTEMKRGDGRSRESRGRVSGSFVSSERNDVARYKRGRVGEAVEGGNGMRGSFRELNCHFATCIRARGLIKFSASGRPGRVGERKKARMRTGVE